MATSPQTHQPRPREHARSGRPSHGQNVLAWMRSARWQKYRAWFWNVPEHQFCADCGCDLLCLPSLQRIIDHKAPHRGDAHLFWGASNHQAMCQSCHGKKCVREGGFGRLPENP